MHIIFNTKELGISEKVPAFNVANRVEILISRNRYLDAPYLVSPLPPVPWERI